MYFRPQRVLVFFVTSKVFLSSVPSLPQDTYGSDVSKFHNGRIRERQAHVRQNYAHLLKAFSRTESV